jgi:hypothetical protein
MANAPGSAFLESSALLGFLPGAGRGTCWAKSCCCPPCPPGGAANARPPCERCCPAGPVRDQAHLPVVDQPRHLQRRRGPLMAPEMLASWADASSACRKSTPCRPTCRQSQIPTWGMRGGRTGIVPRAAMLRVFALSDGAGSWRVLPGGMTRLVSESAGLATMQRGRQQRRHLGAGRRAAARRHRFRPFHAGRLHAHRHRTGAARAPGHQPRGREPVLAGPLHRARRKQRPPGAHHAGQPQRRRRRLAAAVSIGRQIERLGFWLHRAGAGPRHRRRCTTPAGFEAMLALFDSTITFHAQYQQSRDVAALLDLLVMDRDNPRSLGWVAQTLRGRLARLAAARQRTGSAGRPTSPTRPGPGRPVPTLCTHPNQAPGSDPQPWAAPVAGAVHRCGLPRLGRHQPALFHPHPRSLPQPGSLSDALHITHETCYDYRPGGDRAAHVLCLRPRATPRQSVLEPPPGHRPGPAHSAASAPTSTATLHASSRCRRRTSSCA